MRNAERKTILILVLIAGSSCLTVIPSAESNHLGPMAWYADFAGTWYTWGFWKGIVDISVSGTTVSGTPRGDGPSFTAQPYGSYGILKGTWTWPSLSQSGVSITSGEIEIQRGIAPGTWSATAFQGSWGSSWGGSKTKPEWWDTSVTTVTTTSESQELRVQVISDLVGDEGCKFTITVWESTTAPTEKLVTFADLKIVVVEEGTGVLRATENGQTDENGQAILDWTWSPGDRGKTWILDISATKGSARGWAQTSIYAPLVSDRLRVNIDDDNYYDYCTFTVTVLAVGSEEPIPDATLELRVFYVYNFAKRQAINGVFRDYGPYYTDAQGEYSWTWKWDPDRAGDVWRVDVYASKEGYDEDWTNTHVTEGGINLMLEDAQATITIGGQTDSLSAASTTEVSTAENQASAATVPYEVVAIVALASVGAFLLGRRFPAKKEAQSGSLAKA